jgi:rRNA-processing protein FCF1
MVLVTKPIKQLDKVESALGKLTFVVPDIVIDELSNLENKAGPKRALAAKTALEIATTKFEIIKSKRSQHVDDAIIDYAIDKQCAVATIDTDLRRRLVSNNVLVLTLSKNRLVIANPYPNEQL